MSIWLVSDTHLHHSNIIKYCDRPFKDAEEMDKVIIENWNKYVSPGDTVYHLGDVMLARKELLEITIPKLNGNKILIRGNHDRDISDIRFMLAGFDKVYRDPLPLPEHGIILSHYPIVSESGFFNVHGHTHNSDPFLIYLFYRNETHKCISVEMTDYKPISIESLMEEVNHARGTDL